MIVENLIIENEKNIKEIQNILNNNNLNIINNDIIERNNFKEINQKQNNNNFEIIDVRDFDTNKQKIIKNIVVKAISQYSNYKELCVKNIHNCIDWK